MLLIGHKLLASSRGQSKIFTLIPCIFAYQFENTHCGLTHPPNPQSVASTTKKFQ